MTISRQQFREMVYPDGQAEFLIPRMSMTRWERATVNEMRQQARELVEGGGHLQDIHFEVQPVTANWVKVLVKVDANQWLANEELCKLTALGTCPE